MKHEDLLSFSLITFASAALLLADLAVLFVDGFEARLLGLPVPAAAALPESLQDAAVFLLRAGADFCDKA
jgi:hypothetical protein